MAEILTYDSGTDTVTTESNLTEDEQNSLKVGEELESQQEQLLAGKYKDAAELEKAYVELSKKLGEKSEPDSAEESSDEPAAEEKPEQEYLQDGNVNYSQVNETYGEKLGDIFKESNIDPWSINDYFHKNNGTISEDMYSQLEGAGLSRSSIDAYLSGVSETSGYNTNELNESDINSIKESVGGNNSYENIVNWAGQNLDKNSIDAFDDIVTKGNTEAIKLAISGIKAQYDNANGNEGTMYTGKAPTTNKDVFRSQQELVAAMSDRRYDNDPAYRQDVIQKLERSNELEF